MAFKRFSPSRGIWGSDWVGFYQFRRLFDSPNFWIILRNTLVLSVYNIFAGFPFPLIMAICVNHGILYRFKKAVQTITFARPDYSFGTAIGLFQNVVGVIMTLAVNRIANVVTGEGMF
jgi:ABC-type polysaccharide transport system permease subunit